MRLFEFIYKKNLEKIKDKFEDKLCGLNNNLNIVPYNIDNMPESIRKLLGESNEK